MATINHLYKLIAEVTSIHLDGTVSINFLFPATGFSTSIQIPQDNTVPFELGDRIMFGLEDIFTQEEWKEKFETEGRLLTIASPLVTSYLRPCLSHDK